MITTDNNSDVVALPRSLQPTITVQPYTVTTTTQQLGEYASRIPDWFGPADLDRDEQVAMHEYIEVNGFSETTIALFQRYDISGDGFITLPEVVDFPAIQREVLVAQMEQSSRDQRQRDEDEQQQGRGRGRGQRGGRGGGGGGGGGRRGGGDGGFDPSQFAELFTRGGGGRGGFDPSQIAELFGRGGSDAGNNNGDFGGGRGGRGGGRGGRGGGRGGRGGGRGGRGGGRGGGGGGFGGFGGGDN